MANISCENIISSLERDILFYKNENKKFQDLTVENAEYKEKAKELQAQCDSLLNKMDKLRASKDHL